MGWILLFFIEGLSVISDLFTHKIPNLLILTGGILGLFWRGYSGGLPGITDGITGGITALLFLSFLHYFKMLGAGDVKLFMTAGIFLGPAHLFLLFFFTFLNAAVLSLAVLIRHRMVIQRFLYFTHYIRDFYRTGHWEPYIKEKWEKGYLHFSIPVFIGTVFLRYYLFRTGG